MCCSGLTTKIIPLLFVLFQLQSPSDALRHVSIRQDDACEINSICFVMDRSGSIADDYPEEQEFVTAVTRELATRIANVKYSAYGFSDSAVLIQRSTTDLEGVFIPAINAPVEPRGGTNMYSGLNACFDEVKDQMGNRVIVLITDGRDNGFPRAESIAPSIKSSSVAIVSVGVGPDVDEEYLKGLASDPSLFISSEFSSLPRDVTKLADSSCDAVMMMSTTTSPTPSPSPRPTPVADDDLCEKAYQRCAFMFRGRSKVPTFKLRRKSDVPFTPKIVSRRPGEILRVLNVNGIVPEFLNVDGSVQRITKDADASPRFAPTQFKPFYIERAMGSGIGHQKFAGNQKQIAKKRCIRVFFSHYQVLSTSGPRRVEDNLVSKRAKNNCVVFKTK